MRTVASGKAISIIGFRDVKIGDVNAFFERIKTEISTAKVQMFNAAMIAGELHLLFAFLNAQRSFESGRAISESIEMETLLFASGKRQINRAIEMLGLKPKTSNVAIILFAASLEELTEAEKRVFCLLSGKRDDSVMEVKDRYKVEDLMRTFEISNLELNTLTGSDITLNEALIRLIVERTALLAIKR